MANAIVNNNKWVISYDVVEAGNKTIALSQSGTYIDKPVEIHLGVNAGSLGAGTGSTEATSDVNILGTASSTQPVSGHYIKIEGEANISVAASGWIEQGEDVDVAIADVYYPIAEATFATDGSSVKSVAEGYIGSNTTVGTVSNGVKEVTGGSLTAGSGTATIESNGYYNGSSYDTSDALILSSTEAEGYYKLTYTGKGSVNRAAINSQVTTAGYFSADVSPVEESAATSLESNTASNAAFVLKSTLNTDSVTPATYPQTIIIGAGYYPSARTVTVDATTVGAASSSFVNTGLSTYFNAGSSATHDVEITPQHIISTAGYLDATVNPVDGTTVYYTIKQQTVTETVTTVNGTSATRGSRSESAGWKASAETLNAATFANTATQGTTYVDISGTTAAPVLVSNDYLYINGGWTDDLKISLAKLVPDGSNIAGHSDAILSGYSAYDNSGVLVAGSIQTWDGSYTIS